MAFDAGTHPNLHSLYLSRPVDLPPLTAAAAFDVHLDANLDAHVAATQVGPDGATAVMRTGAVELWLLGPSVGPRGPSFPLREARGRLRRAGRGRMVGVAVDVELAAWSATRSEIGIRTSSRAVPLREGQRQRMYFELAVAAAEGMARALESRTEDSLRLSLMGLDPRRSAGRAG